MSQPHISRLNIWESHESRVIEVLLAALAILQSKVGLAQSEIDLNRELYFCLLEADVRAKYQIFNGALLTIRYLIQDIVLVTL
jgi:hypothetical protein